MINYLRPKSVPDTDYSGLDDTFPLLNPRPFDKRMNRWFPHFPLWKRSLFSIQPLLAYDGQYKQLQRFHILTAKSASSKRRNSVRYIFQRFPWIHSCPLTQKQPHWTLALRSEEHTS